MIELTTRTADRILIVLGHLSAWAFIILSLVYFEERLFSFDSAYYFFKLVVNESFNIEHSRTISYTSQWLPLLAIKSGASLKTVSVLYSLSFMLFYYLIYVIHAHVFKSPRTGIMLFLILILSTRFKHYNAVSEVTATMALSSLFVGWMWIKEKYTQWKEWKVTAIGCVLITLNWVGHPIIFLPIIGFLGFYLVHKNKWNDRAYWFVLAYTLVLFILRFSLISSTGYEANKIEALQKAPEIIPSFSNQWTYQHLKDYIFDQYPFAWWSYLVALALLIWRRHFWSALISFLSFAVFVVVVVIIYHKGESLMMLESYYALFGYFWAIAIFAAFMNADRNYTPDYLWLVVLCIYSFVGIYKQHDFFTQRLNYIDELIESAETDKVLLPFESVDWNRLMVPWALPFASLLHSSIDGPDKSATIYVYRDADKNQFGNRLNEPGLFLGAHFNVFEFSQEDLPEKYFRLGQGGYQ